MAKDWQAVLKTKETDWGVPAAASAKLDALITSADAALAAAKNETTRTPVSTAQCKEAFNALGRVHANEI
jgi:hypothetical protein